MYRFLFRPRWLAFHALVIAVVVAFISFGFWQLDRLEQRRDFNTLLTGRLDEPVLTASQLNQSITAADTDPTLIADLEWRRTVLPGDYLGDERITIVNRSQGGRAGDNDVVAFAIDGVDDQLILVNRGFVPLDAEAGPPPAGPVVIEGILRLSEERGLGQLGDPATGDLEIAQRIDLERLDPQFDGRLLPVYLDLRATTPSSTSLTPDDPASAAEFPQPVALPELGDGPHLSYAVQWFIFATAVAIGWVLAVRRSVRRRRHAMTAADTTTDTTASLDSTTTPASREESVAH